MIREIHDYWSSAIPREWMQIRSIDAFRLINGFPFPSEGFNTEGRGAPLIRIRDILSGRTTLSFDGNVGLECTVENGDIVIGMDGDFNVAWWNSGSALLNQRICALRPKARIDPRFVFYQIPISIKIINDLTPSSTVKHLSSLDVLALRLFVPDLATQRIIAIFLDRETSRLDQLIEKKERLAELLAERAIALLEVMVKGKDRGGNRTADSGVEWIGQIPKHWSAPKINQVARLATGHTPSRREEFYWIPEECTIPWFGLADVWQIRREGRVCVSTTNEKISPRGLANSAAELLPAGTVILSRTASVGFPAIMEVPMATTQDFVNWVCGPRLRPKYLYYVLRAMRRELNRLMIGSTHQTIYMPDVRAFRTPLPPLGEQDEIVRRLDRSLTGQKNLTSAIDASVKRLRELRSALIAAAVTGQIDVATWGNRGETDRRLEAIEHELAVEREEAVV